ncbi:unnamed protein product [Ceratitis capitata]|uniref:(Mediterranean fruit fly) hypothetical protein n=1 Tax=Ceratitis capitata TaxID=7213 RepID=A0A811U8U5_CERCA|nr:unnamed protein product [Ceratitis capitata]
MKTEFIQITVLRSLTRALTNKTFPPSAAPATALINRKGVNYCRTVTTNVNNNVNYNNNER